MDNRRHKHRKKRGSLGRQALGVSFVNSVYQDKGYGGVFPSTDIYSYNAQRVNLDYLGNAYLLPAHYLAPEGISYFQNLFAADGVDWTDASNYTEVNATVTQASATEMDVAGLSDNSADHVRIPVLSGVSITGRKFGCVVRVKAMESADVGKDVRIVINRDSGGTASSSIQTITLTAAYQDIFTGSITGAASNTGVYFQVLGATSNAADTCRFQYPGIIEWRTGQDTSKPPMPEDIKCFVPVGPELFTTPTVGGQWVDNADGSYSADGSQVSAIDLTSSKSGSAKTGQSYCISFDIDARTAGTVQAIVDNTSSGTFNSVASHYANILAATATGNIIFRGDANFSGTVSGLSIRESAPGFYASEYTPNTLVLGGVIYENPGDYLELDGTSGGYASLPDTAQNSVTADITLIAYGALNDWTPASGQVFISKWTAFGNQRSYFLSSDPSGALRFGSTGDGTTGDDAYSNSTDAVPFEDGAPGWVRVTYNNSANVVYFYTSTDAPSRPYSEISWTQLGAGVAHSTGGIYDSTSVLSIGALGPGVGSEANGKIMRAAVIASTDPTAIPVVDFNPATALADGWTIHNAGGAAQIKTTAPQLIHPWHWERIGYSVPLKVKDQYDPFATSSTMALNERRIPTSPDDTEQTYSNVDAFPNLLPPAARSNFGTWTRTGDGEAVVYGTAETVYESDFSVNAQTWTQNIGNSNLVVTGAETAPDGTEDCLKITNVSGGGLPCQIRSDNLFVDDGGYVYTISGDIYAVSASFGGNTYPKHGSASTTTSAHLNSDGVPADDTWHSFSAQDFYSGATGGDFRFMLATGETNYTVDSLAPGGEIYFKNLVVTRMSVTDGSISYTTLSDEDDTANEVVFEYNFTIPDDSETHKLSIELSEGTADTSRVDLDLTGGTTTVTTNFALTWADGTTSGTGGEVTENASTSTVTLTAVNNGSGNTNARVRVYPATKAASTQGTVNVHGDVVLQRVSAAAEPTWNTLRPGDSVTQYVLQQEDSETTWNLFNSATTITGLPDPTGGTGAFSLTDAQGAATSYLSQNNLDIAASAGDTIYYGGWLQKEAANDAYPGIALLDIDNGSAFTNMIADKVNGEVIWDTGQEGDWLVCIDGAVFAALFPDVYPDGANFWLIIAAMTAVSANNYRIDIQPARADAFDGGVDTSAQGTATFFRPFVTKNALFPFFDSIATTSTVTEVVQDWSKIFTFLTEADGNVCNAVLGHGYYTNLGVPIEPATTQDMATAAVLATGGSASTYPTQWNAAAGGTYAAVVGEGVSPIHPDARYVDVQFSNSSGSSQTVQLQFNSTPVTGVSQGDEVTLSIHAQLVAGALAGTIALGTVEYNSSDSALTTVFTGTIEPDATMQRFSRTLSITQATAAKYNPRMRILNIPDGSDFTLRLTLPNSVQQSFLSSVILGQETRTSQAGALRYDISNFSVSNTQIRADVSLGIPQADIAAVQNIWAVNSSNANRGLRFGSNGNFGIADSAATTLQIVDWSASADEVIRSSVNFDSGSSTFSMSLYSTTLGTGFDSDAYSGSMAVDQGIAIGDVSLSYPMHIHGLWSIPNGYESSVTLTSDSERYAQ